MRTLQLAVLTAAVTFGGCQLKDAVFGNVCDANDDCVGNYVCVDEVCQRRSRVRVRASATTLPIATRALRSVQIRSA